MKAKNCRQNFRRAIAEAMLSNGVIVGEGITEQDAILVAAQKMELSDDSNFPLDVEAAKIQLPAVLQGSLSIQTFHSFFWEILKAHGYLLGAPRRLRLLLPHDEAALRHEHEGAGQDWDAESERLFVEDGRVVFDLFSKKTLALFQQSARLRSLYYGRHPLIVMDEAQDTAEDQWQKVKEEI